MKTALTLFLVILVIEGITLFYVGIMFERSQHEKEIELTYEAAAQSYKNQTNDTSKFDYYGNPRTEADTLRRVLPKNSRTEIANPAANRDIKQNDNTRKRN